MDLSLPELWDEVFDAGCSETYDPDDKGAKLRALLLKLEQKKDLELYPVWLCLRGYAWYCLHERQKALSDFRLALRIDPEDGWAAMYIAHCLQDDGQHQNALDQANSIALPNAFLNQMLSLKLHELKLVSRLKLFGVENVRKDIGEFLVCCARIDDPPFNLQRALEDTDQSLADWNPPAESVDENAYSIFDSYMDIFRTRPNPKSLQQTSQELLP